MDLKDLFILAKSQNILEKHKLPYNFFTEPVKILTEDTCLEQILHILSNHIKFPDNDSSDVCDMIEGKDTFNDIYNTVKVETIVKTPYIKPTKDTFVNLICFIIFFESNIKNSLVHIHLAMIL